MSNLSFYTNFFSRGNTLFLRRIDGGIRSKQKLDITPELFLTSPNPSTERGLRGEYLSRVPFSNVADARNFIRDNRGSNSKIFGFNRFEYAEINKIFPGDEIDFDTTQLNIVSIDIETTIHHTNAFPNAKQPLEHITLISMQKRGHDILTFGVGPVKLRDVDTDVKYINCASEEDLLKKFLLAWNEYDIDIATGWNCEAFDFPYLYSRIKYVLGEKFARALSPWGMVDEQEVNEEMRVNIAGITILDYMLLYKKFIFVKRKRYKLDYIAEVELGENKLHYDGSFYEFYTNDFSLFTSYNAHDVRLVSRLDAKLQLIDLAATLAYFSKCNFIDTFMNTRIWDVIVANILANRGIHVPTDSVNFKGDFEGAYVKQTIPGLYSWVGSFDLTSLYPSLIMQYNISPETQLPVNTFIRITPEDVLQKTPLYKTAIENALERNATLCANGALYSKEKMGIFPELTAKLFAKRKEYKKTMQQWQKKEQSEGKDYSSMVAKFNNLQMAAKILLNSLYGALGSPYFRHYDLWSAEGITMSGQASIKTAQRSINQYITKVTKNEDDYVIAGDTDSMYVNLSPIVDVLGIGNKPAEAVVDFLDKFSNTHAADVIAAGYVEFAELTNAFENKMDMKRESIGPGIFFGKKNYVMKVYDSEGIRYSSPKTKIVGHEAIESATPDFFQQKMEEMLLMMFENNKHILFDFESETKREYMNQSIDAIAKVQSVSEIDKWVEGDGTKSGCPAHVKGSILYNRLIKEMGIDNKYAKIREGDKIKVLSLKMPNPYGVNRISFPDQFPEEFSDIKMYIDRETDYRKNFVDPMERSINVLGYSFHNQITLEDLFG